MSVQVYAWRLIELALFIPEDMATNALRVCHFRRGLRDDVHLLCRSPQPFCYSEWLNMTLGIEDDQAFIRNSYVTRGGFTNRSVFRHRGQDKAAPYEQAYRKEVERFTEVVFWVIVEDRGVASGAVSKRETRIRL